MKKLSILPLLLLIAAFGGCTKEKQDDIYPEIIMDCCGGYPVNCDEIKRGTTFTFVAKFSDNAELGAFSLDVHHNFDHHTHSTDPMPCEFEPVKSPINPFRLISEYEIPEGSGNYTASVNISIPADADTGDYHMMVRLTDKAGWQTIKGISFKVVE